MSRLSATHTKGELSISSTEGVRIAAIFVIFVVSFIAAFFPTFAQRVRAIRVPSLLFFVGKHFGTGVILSTAFIHLLTDAFQNLDGMRLAGYKNWPGLIVLTSLLAIFLVEYISTVYVENLTARRESSDKSGGPVTHEHEVREAGHDHSVPTEATGLLDQESQHQRTGYLNLFMHHHGHNHSGGFCPIMAERRDKTMQLLSVLVLQLGIMLHSFVIGLTLAVTSTRHLPSLLTAIFFHQLFEGLSLGVRLSTLPSSIPVIHPRPANAAGPAPPPTWRSIKFIPGLLAFLFGITTPIGIAFGMLLEHISPGSTGAAGGHSIFNGVMAATSAGLLIYAGCVELLGGDFVQDAEMRNASFGRQLTAIVSLGCGVVAMALVG